MYRILDAVNWAPPGSLSPLLSRAGFKHGFVGRGATKPGDLYHVKQVHGTRVTLASGIASGPDALSRTEADGIWSSEAGTSVAVKTADCLPVLVGDPVTRRVMAVHAGWRGLCAGILGEALRQLEAVGCKAEHLVASIGPAVSREHYEVGAEVIHALFHGKISLNETQAALAVAKGKADRWHLDLKVAAVFDLLNHGLKAEQVEVIQTCTVGEADWHSFRREGAGCGSNWSWIAL